MLPCRAPPYIEEYPRQSHPTKPPGSNAATRWPLPRSIAFSDPRKGGGPLRVGGILGLGLRVGRVRYTSVCQVPVRFLGAECPDRCAHLCYTGGVRWWGRWLPVVPALASGGLLLWLCLLRSAGRSAGRRSARVGCAACCWLRRLGPSPAPCSAARSPPRCARARSRPGGRVGWACRWPSAPSPAWSSCPCPSRLLAARAGQRASASCGLSAAPSLASAGCCCRPASCRPGGCPVANVACRGSSGCLAAVPSGAACGSCARFPVCRRSGACCWRRVAWRLRLRALALGRVALLGPAPSWVPCPARAGVSGCSSCPCVVSPPSPRGGPAAPAAAQLALF
jgi:hypothetical protein